MTRIRRTCPLVALVFFTLTMGTEVPSHATSPPDFPLVHIADVPLPGKANRFDYQEIEPANRHLVIAHMSDASVVVVNLADGSVAKLVSGISTPRGVAVGDDIGRIFVTSSPSALVLIDAKTLVEVGRVTTGRGPDGVAYDAADRVVAVSDQRDGAISLLDGAGNGRRKQVRLGVETGNVVFDPTRRVFWATVVRGAPQDVLVSVDPIEGKVAARIELAACKGAHGLRLHPDGQRAFVACEDSDEVVGVDLSTSRVSGTVSTGRGPDVMSIDPGRGWLYVASESGDLVVLDIRKRDLVVVDREHIGENAHSVAIDPATHRAFFPLAVGAKGKPVLRIMAPRAASERH
jgi:YVTN family beta-propeller protein